MLSAVCALLSALALTACEDDAPQISPDPNRPGTAEDIADGKKGQLSLASNPSYEFTTLYLYNECTDEIYIKLFEPAKKDVSYTIAVDKDHDFITNESYLKTQFNNVYIGFSENLLNNIEIPTATIEIKENETISSKAELIISNSFNCRNCIIPIVATGDDGTEFRLFIMLYSFEDPAENREDKGKTIFAYINTEEVNPLVVRSLYFSLTYYKSRRERQKIFLNMPLVDVVNLEKAQVKFNKSSGDIDIVCTSDMSHVLKNSSAMIKPLQQMGIKVCLTIKGGGDGYGFANLTDSQIAKLADQIATYIDMFQLDGVNLSDEGANYQSDGAPEINSTSYPKLIKALRTRMPKKMITLGDDGGTIAEMDGEIDGVEVGGLVDYVLNVKFDQYNNPWDDNQRVPMPGLSKDRYALASYKVELKSNEETMKFEEVYTTINSICTSNDFDKCGVLANIPILRL